MNMFYILWHFMVINCRLEGRVVSHVAFSQYISRKFWKIFRKKVCQLLPNAGRFCFTQGMCCAEVVCILDVIEVGVWRFYVSVWRMNSLIYSAGTVNSLIYSAGRVRIFRVWNDSLQFCRGSRLARVRIVVFCRTNSFLSS
jgi:hypothetical protein